MDHSYSVSDVAAEFAKYPRLKEVSRQSACFLLTRGVSQFAQTYFKFTRSAGWFDVPHGPQRQSDEAERDEAGHTTGLQCEQGRALDLFISFILSIL